MYDVLKIVQGFRRNTLTTEQNCDPSYKGDTNAGGKETNSEDPTRSLFCSEIPD